MGSTDQVRTLTPRVNAGVLEPLKKQRKLKKISHTLKKGVFSDDGEERQLVDLDADFSVKKSTARRRSKTRPIARSSRKDGRKASNKN